MVGEGQSSGDIRGKLQYTCVHICVFVFVCVHVDCYVYVCTGPPFHATGTMNIIVLVYGVHSSARVRTSVRDSFGSDSFDAAVRGSDCRTSRRRRLSGHGTTAAVRFFHDTRTTVHEHIIATVNRMPNKPTGERPDEAMS